MVQDFHLFDTTFSFFVIINWLYAIFCSWWLYDLFRNRRYLFIKPSIFLISYTHLFFQWPLAIFAGYYENWLPNPYTMIVLVHGYVVFGLAGSVLSQEREASRIWNAIHRYEWNKYSNTRIKTIFILAGIVFAVTAAYLSYVPITSTGLYAILFSPDTSGVAREESLKLLDYGGLKYAYSIMSSSVVPLLAALLTMQLLSDKENRKVLLVVPIVLVLIFAGISVSLTGTRAGLFNMAIVVAFVVLWKRGLTVKPGTVIIIILAAISPAIFLSLLREGKEIGEFAKLYFTYLGYISNRAFLMPFHVGGWYIHHAQEYGVLGIGAFPKLAGLFGVGPLDGPNIIGLAYASRYYGLPVMESISATAGYLFSSYGYIGIAALPLSLLGLWLTDVSILVYRRLGGYILIPCVASISLATLMFVQSDYTVVWITHGFGTILLLSLVLTKIFQDRQS